jgi:hypothetical protein
MPRHSSLLSASRSSSRLTGFSLLCVASQEQATQILIHAHQLLAKIVEESQALEHCLMVLQKAPAQACFFY